MDFKTMNLHDLKLYLINGVVFFSTFTTLEEKLKILLVAVTIIYTIVKTINEIKKSKNDNKKK